MQQTHNVTIGDFISRYEKTYGDILQNKRHFVQVYNAYCDKMGYRTPTEIKTPWIHNGEKRIDIQIKYIYSQWGAWSWDNYAYYKRIPNHTRIEYDSMIMDRTITHLHNKYVHEECNGIVAYNKITRR